MSMNRRQFRDICVLLGAGLIVVFFMPNPVFGFSGGPPNGLTGAPGEDTCVSCHADFPLNTGPGTLEIDAPVMFEPGETYEITVTLTQEGQSRWGFEFSPLEFGECTITDETMTQLGTEGDNTYVKQTAAGTFPGSGGPVSWSFDWTAPSEPVSSITVYASGNAADGDGSTGGDFIYTSSMILGLVPVELTCFSGSITDAGVVLSWKTHSECRNHGFLIHRREDSDTNWERIGFIPGAGTTGVPHTYTFLDDSVIPGQDYQYRIADISTNGAITYHYPIALTIPLVTDFEISISPQPAGMYLDLSIDAEVPGPVSVGIHTLDGRLIREFRNHPFNADNSSLRWDLNTGHGKVVGSGTYVCRVESGTCVEIHPVIVVR